MFSTFAFNSPSIVNDGLITYIDSADRTSYSTTGTSWYTLTPQNIIPSCSLVNGPTYTSSFGGYITFDGTNDYAVANYANSASFNGTASYTAEVWVYPQPMVSISSYFVIFGRYSSVTGGNHGWDISYTQNTANVPPASGSAFVYVERLGGTGNQVNVNELVPTSSFYNNWHQLVLTYDGSIMRMYRNGVFKRGVTASYAITNTAAPNMLAARPSVSPSVFTNTRISIARLYNRALSATEVTQNFNAHRQRFNI